MKRRLSDEELSDREDVIRERTEAIRLERGRGSRYAKLYTRTPREQAEWEVESAEMDAALGDFDGDGQ